MYACKCRKHIIQHGISPYLSLFVCVLLWSINDHNHRHYYPFHHYHYHYNSFVCYILLYCIYDDDDDVDDVDSLTFFSYESLCLYFKAI